MSSNKRDYYKVLGISKSASESDIKKAYRKLAMKFHPDNAKRKKLSESETKSYEEKFKEIGEAYAILSDSEKKSQYDTFGHAAFSGGRSGRQSGFGGIKFDFGGGDAFDIFSQVFGSGFGDIYQGRQSRSSGNPFSGNSFGQQQRKPEKGENITIPLKIGQDEAKAGITKIITMSVNKAGRSKKESLKVKVPAGVRDGGKLRLKGKGKPGKNGGDYGDLFVQINLMPSEPQTQVFRINLFQALLGAELQIDTPAGNISYMIESGIQNGEIVLFPEHGDFIGDSKLRKDLEIEFRIILPRLQTSEQKEIVKQLAKALMINLD